MSRWQEKFEAHPIHETLNELKRLSNIEFDDVEVQEIAERRRFNKVISAFQGGLASLDAEIVPHNQLDSLNAALRHQNIWGQVNTYSNNGNIAHIAAANDHITSQLPPLSLLLAFCDNPSKLPEVKDLEETVDYVANALSTKKDKLTEQFDELSDSVTVVQQSIEKLETIIEARVAETAAQMSTWQQQFSEAQERRGTDYTAWREKIDEKTDASVQTLIAKSNDALSEHQSEFVGKIDGYINDADSKHKAILDLYELVASDSVGAGYLKNAEDEKKLANIWRRVAIGFIFLTAGWLFYAYCHQPAVADGGNIIWSKLMSIASLTGVFLFGAAYSSQQSNRHRSNEKRTRWFALQVKAIDPFINSLEEADRNQLKRLLSEKLFGNFDEGNEKGGAIIDEHALKVIVKSVTDILSKVPS